MLKALIFDFDGLILDTETPELESWQKIFRDHGVELSAQIWGQIVGGAGLNHFDPAEYLQELLGSPIQQAEILEQAHLMSNKIIQSQVILPGARKLISSARDQSFGLAIASSSPHSWVDEHLSRLGLYNYFNVILCADDVTHTKPYPDLFLSALKALGVNAAEAVVFEDSPNGIQAANKAGIFSVAIPNQVTIQLDLSHADLLLNSLEDISIEQLVARFKN